MATIADAREVLPECLGNPSPRSPDVRVVVEERAIAELVRRGAPSEAEARELARRALDEMGGYVETVSLRAFGSGEERHEVWYLPVD